MGQWRASTVAGGLSRSVPAGNKATLLLGVTLGSLMTLVSLLVMTSGTQCPAPDHAAQPNGGCPLPNRRDWLALAGACQPGLAPQPASRPAQHLSPHPAPLSHPSAPPRLNRLSPALPPAPQ
jgi:hypothetical protein